MADRIFSDWIAAYISHTAHLEAPDVFHFWTAVSCVAGALRRRVWISGGYFDWVPNFYIVLVAPPGVANKSTTINVGMQILKSIDGINFGPNAITMPALVQVMAQATEGVLMNEATGEYVPMSCVTIAASELGTLFNPHDREMVDVLVDLWDGRRDVWKKVTKMSGSESIENPWLNIIACTTPGWISEHMPESMVGGGFTSRCIFVYADKKRRLVAYPKKHLPKDFDENAWRLKVDLEKIAMLKGEFTLSPEAEALGEQWYTTDKDRELKHLVGERFGGYVARKQTHVHKLAMVLSASKRDSLVIETEDLEAAFAIMTATELDMERTFSKVGQSDTGRRISEVVDVVRARGQIDLQDLMRLMMRTLNHKEFELVLNSAILAGVVEKRQAGDRIIIKALR